MPQERGGGLEDTGTGNMGYPNLGKEKGCNSEQKYLWEAREELGCLAGVPELRLGFRAALEGLMSVRCRARVEWRGSYLCSRRSPYTPACLFLRTLTEMDGVTET